MAWDPCVTCGRSFHGPTEFSYVTWHKGEERFAFRLRQCADCSAGLRNQVLEQGDRRGDDGQWQRSELVVEQLRAAVAPPKPARKAS